MWWRMFWVGSHFAYVCIDDKGVGIDRAVSRYKFGKLGWMRKQTMPHKMTNNTMLICLLILLTLFYKYYLPQLSMEFSTIFIYF